MYKKQFPNIFSFFFSRRIYIFLLFPRGYIRQQSGAEKGYLKIMGPFLHALVSFVLWTRGWRGGWSTLAIHFSPKKRRLINFEKNKNVIHKSMTELARYSDAVKFTAIFSKNYPPKLSLALSQSNFGINSNFWNQIFSHSAQL